MDDTKLQPTPTEADFPESQIELQAEPQTGSQAEAQAKPQTEAQTRSQSEAQAKPQTEAQTRSQSEAQEAKQDPQPTTTNDTAEAASAKPQDSQSIASDTANDTTDDAANSTTAANTTLAKPKKSPKGLLIAIAIVIVAALAIGGTVWALVFSQSNTNNDSGSQPGDQSSTNGTTPNLITDFDLAFLKNAEANQLYSPLSIKYALGMLEAGAAGDSKQQIEAAIGSLTPQKYPNNEHTSFANALFINNTLPNDEIKTSYIKDINEQFGAEILRVPFTSATQINNWVSDKTFDLIKDLLTDEMLKTPGGPEQYFALVNALAIDMEWINKIQPFDEDYHVSFQNINYSSSVEMFKFTGFTKLPFDNSAIDVNSLRLAATIHKYDILSDLGIDNIRQTIIDEYTDWLNNEENTCSEGWPAPEDYVEQYLEELGDGGYKAVSSSTDFSLYDDDEVKVFAKDLQTYDNITLQYVGVMPKSTSLKDYIQNLTTDKLASTISQIKPITLENFKDGVVTNIIANIPVFKFEDKLDLVNTLKGIGITDVFSETNANLSNLANNPEGLYIGEAIHQTTIDFSNDGIKASAATALVGGKGSSGCGFHYAFDVPVEKIDLTFDNPYLFLIRDKNSGTIWFMGTVYEPTAYTSPSYEH